MDPATGGIESSSGQMGTGSGTGFEFGAGTGYGSGTETQPGSGSQAMLADGSYLAGLAMGESSRAFFPLNLAGSALATTLVSLVFL